MSTEIEWIDDMSQIPLDGTVVLVHWDSHPRVAYFNPRRHEGVFEAWSNTGYYSHMDLCLRRWQIAKWAPITCNLYQSIIADHYCPGWAKSSKVDIVPMRWFEKLIQWWRYFNVLR